MQITSAQCYKIAAETGVDPRTIERVYDGRPARRVSRERVLRAARKLRLPLPPLAKEAP